MATELLEAVSTQPAEPTPWRWTREEYYRMDELGLFQGQRVELIEGEVIQMPAQGIRHVAGTDKTAETLRRVFGKGFWVRHQAPVIVSPHSEPEPDVSVVRGSREDYADHPIAALLAVEVSDTTLAFDRGRKASLYAMWGMEDYWIVNLVDRLLEVRRDPAPDATAPFGFSYRSLVVLKPIDVVTPLAAPDVSIPVIDFLP